MATTRPTLPAQIWRRFKGKAKRWVFCRVTRVLSTYWAKLLGQYLGAEERLGPQRVWLHQVLCVNCGAEDPEPRMPRCCCAHGAGDGKWVLRAMLGQRVKAWSPANDAGLIA